MNKLIHAIIVIRKLLRADHCSRPEVSHVCYWERAMWLVQTEVYLKQEVHTGFSGFGTNKQKFKILC